MKSKCPRRIEVSLPDNIANALELLAKQTGSSVSQVARSILIGVLTEDDSTPSSAPQSLLSLAVNGPAKASTPQIMGG